MTYFPTSVAPDQSDCIVLRIRKEEIDVFSQLSVFLLTDNPGLETEVCKIWKIENAISVRPSVVSLPALGACRSSPVSFQIAVRSQVPVDPKEVRLFLVSTDGKESALDTKSVVGTNLLGPYVHGFTIIVSLNRIFDADSDFARYVELLPGGRDHVATARVARGNFEIGDVQLRFEEQ